MSCPGIRQLQLMLLKIALLLAVEVHVGVEFVKLLEPEDQENQGDASSVFSTSPSVPQYNYLFMVCYHMLHAM